MAFVIAEDQHVGVIGLAFDGEFAFVMAPVMGFAEHAQIMGVGDTTVFPMVNMVHL